MLFRQATLSTALLLGLTASPALLAEPLYNQVALRAEVGSEVTQDRMHVILFTEAQDTDPAHLANQITTTLNHALARARQAEGVTVGTGNRSSYPVYDKEGSQITGWRERAELRLESGDFATLSQLTGELMANLKMASLQFSVSDALRKQNEEALLKEAVAAFRARARLATDALGGRDYKLVSLNLNTGGFQPMMRASAMKADRMESMITPDVEPGTQHITFSADGVIEVQMP